MYSNSHKKLLQVFVQDVIIEEDDVKRLVYSFFGTTHNVNAVIALINNKLDPLYMMIKNVTCDITETKYWVLVSTIHTAVTKFQTTYSKNEVNYFYHVLNNIIQSEHKQVPETDILNLRSECNITLSNADQFLKLMTELKYFVNQDGYFYVGARSKGELLPYFKRMFHSEQLAFCVLCKEIIFCGKQFDDCHCSSHTKCFEQYTLVNNITKCPTHG